MALLLMRSCGLAMTPSTHSICIAACRYNVKRRLEKKPPVTEAAFEAMIEQQDDVSDCRTMLSGITQHVYSREMPKASVIPAYRHQVVHSTVP
jgi:hypothetical protein